MRIDRRHVNGGTGQVPSIISTGVRIAGDLTSDGEVHIDGLVEGDVRANAVTVSPCGRVSGAITGDTVRIEGEVDGQITGQSVSLAATARVKGDIAHDTLALEQGARFEGHCQPVADTKCQPVTDTRPKADLAVATVGSGSKALTTANAPASLLTGGDPAKSPERAA